MSSELDVDQVLELMMNGFTREGACIAVAESHNEGEEYVERLLNDPLVRNERELIP